MASPQHQWEGLLLLTIFMTKRKKKDLSLEGLVRGLIVRAFQCPDPLCAASLPNTRGEIL